MTDQNDEQTGNPAAAPAPERAPFAVSVTALHEMEQESAHLEETMNEARDAVHAAHQANTMATPGTESGEPGDDVVGGDADGPVVSGRSPEAAELARAEAEPEPESAQLHPAEPEPQKPR
jgi:hypothetical protein